MAGAHVVGLELLRHGEREAAAAGFLILFGGDVLTLDLWWMVKQRQCTKGNGGEGR